MEALIKKYSGLVPEKLINEIQESIPKGTSQKKIEQIFEKVYQEYLNARAEPGESVGVVTAESIGEPSTQMTLDTFHLAGVSEVNVTTGLPRLLEILDGRKNISTATMEIHLKSPYNEGKEIKSIASRLRQTSLKNYVKNFDINISEATMTVTLDTDALSKADIDVKKTSRVVEKSLRGFKCSLDGEDKLVIKSSKNTGNINDLYKIKEQVKEVFVGGVKGLHQVVPVKRENEHVIVTGGSNLKEVFKFDFVDTYRTISNDIFEVEKYFGIEAARELIIREVRNVLEEQGVPVDVRHILLVADAMTMSGHVLGVNRYGIVKEKPSVLARASFETPIRHLISAGLTGEVNGLNSVIENVMVNQPVPTGTGLPGLVTSGMLNPAKKSASKKSASKTSSSSSKKTTKRTSKQSTKSASKKSSSKKTTASSSKKTTKKAAKKASKKTSKKAAKKSSKK